MGQGEEGGGLGQVRGRRGAAGQRGAGGRYAGRGFNMPHTAAWPAIRWRRRQPVRGAAVAENGCTRGIQDVLGGFTMPILHASSSQVIIIVAFLC